MSRGDRCVEAKSRKRRFPTVDEIARQYYLLAKATMGNRNVSSIYTIHSYDLCEAKFSDAIERFRRKIGTLAQSEGFETIILDSRDLSVKDRNELAHLVDSDDKDAVSGTPNREKGCRNRLYFQLQRTRAP